MNWHLFITGLIFIPFGLGVLSDPVVTMKYGMVVDIGMARYPAGLIALGGGLYFLVRSFSRKPKHDYSNWICPKCEKAKMRSLLVDDKCPDCGVLMAPLKGFYKKHPELKK